MKTKAEFFLFLVTIIWAGTFVIIKPTLNDISPITLVTIRFFLSSFIIFIFFRKAIVDIPIDTIKKGSVLGFLLYIGFAVQTIGMQYTTATKSALITGTFVIFTPILQTIIERRKPRLANIIGVIIVTFGMLFLSSDRSNIGEFLLNLGSDFNIGDLLTLICAIFYAIYIVYLDKISASTKFIHMVWLQILFTAVMSFITAIVFHLIDLEKIRMVFNSQVIFTLLYTAILATAVTTFLQTKYQKFTTPTKAAIIFTCEPLFASILAFFVLNEHIGFFGVMGGILIILGVLISEIFDKIKINN